MKELLINASKVQDEYENGEYLNKNPSWHLEDSSWKADKIFNLLLKNKLNSKNFAEVGCGAWEILSQLSCRLPQSIFSGFEISPQAYNLSKSRMSARVNFYLKNILDDDVTYDCLLCLDVFEHIDDYMGFLRSLKVKSEYKIFHIPLEINAQSLLKNLMIAGRNDYGHLHYFTKETALATLQDTGYSIVDWCFTPYFDELHSKTLKNKIGQLPRKILKMISPELQVKLLGGSSLLVLAK